MKFESSEWSIKGKPTKVWRVSHTKRYWGPYCGSPTKAFIAWCLVGTRFARGGVRLWNWATYVKPKEGLHE